MEQNSSSEELKCRICSNADDNSPLLAKEKMFATLEQFNYFTCKKCKCLQIDSEPNDMAKHYPEDYYSFDKPKEKFYKRIIKKLRNKYAVSRNSFLGSLIYKKFPSEGIFGLGELGLDWSSSILDVGCGAGSLLRSLADLGFENVLGVDPFVSEDLFINGKLLVKKDHVENLEGEFDLIMMHHSLEHMFDQQKVLKSLKKLLKKDGTILIRIPLANFAFEKYKENWVQLDAPRHFYLHTPESFEQLANDCGFELDRTIYDSNSFQFWGSEQYLKDIPLFSEQSYAKNKSAFSEEEIRSFEEKAKKLNEEMQGDQACFYLIHK